MIQFITSSLPLAFDYLQHANTGDREYLGVSLHLIAFQKRAHKEGHQDMLPDHSRSHFSDH